MCSLKNEEMEEKKADTPKGVKPSRLEDKVVNVIVGVVILSIVGYFLLSVISVALTPMIHSWDTGRVELDVSQFTDSFEPESRNVIITGRLLSGAGVKKEYLYQNKPRYSFYFPMVPESWSEGEPVRVVVRVESPSESLVLKGVQSVTGVLRNVLFEGLPREIEQSLESRGVKLTSGHVFVTGSISTKTP
jgi:hypothetical protein